MLRLSLAAAALGASLCAAFPARAELPPRAAPPGAESASAATSTSTPAVPNVRAALAVGAAAMLLPGIIGGTRAALGATDGQKTAGLLFASAGFTLSPIVSHLVTGEPTRAVLFSIVPIVTTVAATALVTAIPGAVYHGNMTTRSAFGILLGLGLLDAAVSFADTAMAADRAREKLKRKPGKTGDRGRLDLRDAFFVLPTAGPDGAGFAFGGVL